MLLGLSGRLSILGWKRGRSEPKNNHRFRLENRIVLGVKRTHCGDFTICVVSAPLANEGLRGIRSVDWRGVPSSRLLASRKD